MRNRTKSALGLVVATVAVLGLRGAGTASAAAGPCDRYWEDKDHGSSQTVNQVSGTTGVNMRNAPLTYCSLITKVPWGHWVALDCFVHGGSPVNGVTTWSHVRYSNGGPVYNGWISDYYLSGQGSNFNCDA